MEQITQPVDAQRIRIEAESKPTCRPDGAAPRRSERGPITLLAPKAKKTRARSCNQPLRRETGPLGGGPAAQFLARGGLGVLGGVGAPSQGPRGDGPPSEGRHSAFPTRRKARSGRRQPQRKEGTPIRVPGKAECLPSKGPSVRMCKPSRPFPRAFARLVWPGAVGFRSFCSRGDGAVDDVLAD